MNLVHGISIGLKLTPFVALVTAGSVLLAAGYDWGIVPMAVGMFVPLIAVGISADRLMKPRDRA